jgi:hypothetical protein
MDEEAKRIILARRARFVAATIASLGVATHSCGGRSTTGPDSGSVDGGRGGASSVAGAVNSGGVGAQICLSVGAWAGFAAGGTPTSGSAGVAAGGRPTGGRAGAGPEVCLSGEGGSSGGGGTKPDVCLSGGVPGDGGEAGQAGEVSTTDAGPQPCLVPPA